MVQYIHNFYSAAGENGVKIVPYIYTFFIQFAADENNMGFFRGQNGSTYIHCFQNLPQTEKSRFFGGQNNAIYTNLVGFFRGGGGGQNAAIHKF
jgi:hypothetical protein